MNHYQILVGLLLLRPGMVRLSSNALILRIRAQNCLDPENRKCELQTFGVMLVFFSLLVTFVEFFTFRGILRPMNYFQISCITCPSEWPAFPHKEVGAWVKGV